MLSAIRLAFCGLILQPRINPTVQGIASYIVFDILREQFKALDRCSTSVAKTFDLCAFDLFTTSVY